MPSISMFYGIIIYMYGRDNKQHNLPHIHAKYAGEYAVFDIATGELLDGKIPQKQIQLVKTWILLRQEELFANWELAVSGDVPYKILPLQ
ncbi:MAG: DUF4160 domain-containing protein [Firmicutes bacterium]|nr:DUF4160 domain-containing protein [Bacillota bacterium]